MYSYKHPHPAVTTDIVLFTIEQGDLKVLLIERAAEPYAGQWALPGGFVQIDEDLKAAAVRELQEETGVTGVYLEQLYTYGEPNRDQRERVITIAYYAMIAMNKINLSAASDASDVRWFSFKKLPALAFDHHRIITMAHDRLASKVDYSTIAFQFMPDDFTLGELQGVYESIQGEVLDKRNFRKRILTYQCLQDTGRKQRNGNHRPARLYTVRSPGKVEYIK
jgi:8-oxo-dGTP diphosphatase